VTTPPFRVTAPDPFVATRTAPFVTSFRTVSVVEPGNPT
jgi:hypothetical protein